MSFIVFIFGFLLIAIVPFQLSQKGDTPKDMLLITILLCGLIFCSFGVHLENVKSEMFKTSNVKYHYQQVKFHECMGKRLKYKLTYKEESFPQITNYCRKDAQK